MLVSGQLDVIAPGVRRLVARNASYMTGPGTNTYLLGHERFLVIDPGPSDAVHVERILAATNGRIDAVLVTHTHPDHSPAAKALIEASGVPAMGRPAPDDGRQDATVTLTRELNDGDHVRGDAHQLRALHTPGHASNHVCYLLEGAGLLFTGDHLMQGSTVVIAPPDGDMQDYLSSLQRLQREPISRLAPGHGSVLEDAQAEIAAVIAHRLRREAKVISRLQAVGLAALDALVTSVYDDVDPRLHPLAKSSLLAHLLKLEREGRAVRESHAAGEVWLMKKG